MFIKYLRVYFSVNDFKDYEITKNNFDKDFFEERPEYFYDISQFDEKCFLYAADNDNELIKIYKLGLQILEIQLLDSSYDILDSIKYYYNDGGNIIYNEYYDKTIIITYKYIKKINENSNIEFTIHQDLPDSHIDLIHNDVYELDKGKYLSKNITECLLNNKSVEIVNNNAVTIDNKIIYLGTGCGESL